jgi:LPS sulfotransferase NodH
MGQRVSYLICTTHRSGSNLLCEILRGTGLTGNPEEYFFEGFQAKWFEAFGANSFPDYLKKVVQAAATDNGVFGAKIMAAHFWHFVNEARQTPQYQAQDISPAELLTDLFPGLHCIWLTRRDKIRQAVSYVKASQSGIWHSTQVHKKPRKELTYDVKAIGEAIQYLAWQDTLWQDYFAQSAIAPLTLVYEDFSQKPAETVDQIIKYLKITKPAHWSMNEIKQGEKMGDSASEEWVKRYVEQQGYLVNFVQPTNLGISRDSHAGLSADKSSSASLPEKEVKSPRISLLNETEQTLVEQQQFLNRLSSKDIAHRIPIRKIIEAVGFKITSKLSNYF